MSMFTYATRHGNTIRVQHHTSTQAVIQNHNGITWRVGASTLTDERTGPARLAFMSSAEKRAALTTAATASTARAAVHADRAGDPLFDLIPDEDAARSVLWSVETLTGAPLARERESLAAEVRGRLRTWAEARRVSRGSR